MCLPVLSHLFLSVCVCAIYLWSRSSFQVRRFTFLSADVDKTIDLVAYWRLTFTDCNKTHFCCQFWLHSLYSWWFGWFSQLFQWILHWSSRFGPVGERNKTNNNCMLHYSLHHTDAVWSRMKVEQDKSFSTAALWFIQTEKKGLVAVLQSALILWDLSIWGGGVGALLACHTYGFWCDWAFMALLAGLV